MGLDVKQGIPAWVLLRVTQSDKFMRLFVVSFQLIRGYKVPQNLQL